MKNLYYIVMITFLLCLSQITRAQTSSQLTGSVKDAKGVAVPFASVAVVQTSTSKIVTGVTTDEQGAFAIKTPAVGTYLLRITAIGFTNFDSSPFEVNNAEFSKNFGTLTVQEDTKLLKEVTVQSMRPKVVAQADKMVVSVEGTALAAGSTAYEVLAKSPGVFIDQDGNIQLNGKGGIQIMIDGKLTYLSGKELQTMLQGMSAENLKDIEIITNPSAKYDAEGNAGILNINLKKNSLTGVNGSVYVGNFYNGMSGYSTGGTLNYKKGKWSTSANFDAARRVFYRNATFTREFNTDSSSSRQVSTARQEDVRQVPSLRLSTDYDITDKHSVGVTANLYYQDFGSNFKTRTFTSNGNPETDSLITATNLINGTFSNYTFNGHYMGKLDTAGTTLSADVDYVMINNNGESRFFNLYQQLKTGNSRLVLPGSDNPSDYNIFSAKTDFTKPFSKDTKMELGAKVSSVVSDNDLRFFYNVDNVHIPDVLKSNHFIYKEKIFAAYANFNTKLSEKWSLQSGLRAEKTLGEGNLLTTNTTFKRDYLNLFPSIFLMHNISKDYQISYNYSRRINRPRYESMNPFVFYIDPYTYAQGNPNLRPAYTNSFEMTQTLKSKYIFKIGYSVTTDFIAEVPEQYPEQNRTVFMQTNVKRYENVNSNLVLPIKISKNWDMNNTFNVAYQDYTIEQKERSLRNKQLSYYGQSTQNIQLPKKIRLEVNAFYQGPGAYALYRISSLWGIDVGLKRSFLNEKLEFSVNVNDIFRGQQIIGKANYNGNINEFDQYFGSRSFRVNLRYRFNKGAKFEEKKRNTNLEELNRAGGGGGN
ncbi:TonB-dependent receptor domain-containing protein [Adhaeribacter radiodurans]|uniref:TonB-dependent receptor n=1 Tax=Adhaeribacter radiodurans TaxID=2745197 RepID=A0A7L7L4V8_9BACT|nr:TonB-dependent receptor [Adhaeribacter radiodurans]QMU27837.1 TonB-dependent receptor [Adhaeribacter radiodurans]